MLGADGRLWVVKFQNNPQHVRVLANELIASRLAEALGFTVPTTEVIEVSEELIAKDPNLHLEFPRGRKEGYMHGYQFGSAFVGGLMPGHVVDYLGERELREVRNHAEFAGMLVLDKWTCNCDGRQAVFHRSSLQKKYTATFIDQGYCFNAGKWNFPDSPLRSIYARKSVYANVIGWASFEPWLNRLESMSQSTVWQVGDAVPSLWYGSEVASLEKLLRVLIERRTRVRELIEAFRDSESNPFPNWRVE